MAKNNCSLLSTRGSPNELDSLRRSLMMLTPGVPGLSREETIRLVDELCDGEERLELLVTGLRRLLDQAEARG